jgi:putative tricarboxylic transport membrane protein
MRRKNIIAAVVIILLTIIYATMTSQLPTRSLPDTPGPTFFPWVNTFLLLVLSVSLLIKSISTNKNIEPNKENKKTSSKTKPTTLAFIVFIFYLVLLPILGFIIATIPFFAMMMVLFSEKRVLHIVVASVSFTTFFYILFRHGFNIFLPIGEWQNLIAILSS